MNVNTIAPSITLLTSTVSVSAFFLAAAATSPVATAAYLVSSVAALSFSMASVAAWNDDHSNNINAYFENTLKHNKHFFVLAVQAVGLLFIKSISDGFSQEIKGIVSKKFQKIPVNKI